MSSGTSTSKTDSSSVTQIPQWMQQAGQQNYAFAQDVAARPLQQYQGQMVPDIAPQTQQAWNLAASSGDVGQDQYGASTAGYLNALGQRPYNVRPQSLAALSAATQYGAPSNLTNVGSGMPWGATTSSLGSPQSNAGLGAYMNPYTQSVINTTLPIYQQNLALSQNQQQNQANAANAFGGSRMGVQAGVTQAQGAQGMAQMAAGLNQSNFQQAQAGAQYDITNRLNASLANQKAQQDKINSDILASQGLTNTGNALNQANQQNYNMLTSAGAGQSMQAQNVINAQMAKFNQAQQYPNQQLATLLSALGMTPHDTATTGTSTTETTTPTNWANILTSGIDAGTKLWAASDKKVKKDITSLSADPQTGVPIKSFRYKGQTAAAPKTIGPLAQDVEKAAPGSTSKRGGVMGMPKATMAAATPSVASSPAFSAHAPGPPLGALSGGLDALMPTQKNAKSALVKPRAGAKGLHGLANTKRGPSIVGALGG